MIAFISLLVLALITQAKYIQVPAVVNDDTLSLRLNQLHRVSSVFHQFGQLKRIFKKQAYEIVNGSETAFPTCYEEMPYALLQAQSSIYVGSGKNVNGLVYDFDQIKNRRNLIDIEMIDKNIFYARQDGYIRMVSIASNNLKLSLMKELKTAETMLTKGNIVLLINASYQKIKGYGVFINHNQAAIFDLQGNSFAQLEGFSKMKDFESAVPLEDHYFAAAYGQQGVVIYSVDFKLKKLKIEAKFNKDNLDIKNLDIRDLAYDFNRKLLFMLDHNSGVLSLQLILSANGLKAQLSSSVIKNNFCNLIYYDSFTEQLYLNCRELIKYHINNWPVLDLKVLPRQQISIRSISSAGGSVVLAGRNVLQVIAQERKVAVYEDKLLQKFILKDKMFLSANEHYLLLGTYEIIPPQVSCQTSQTIQVGNHKLLFKITAQCNVQYFSSIGFNPGQILQDDKCVYSVYQSVNFWQPKEVNVKVFLYIIGAIFLLALGLLIWWGISRLKLKKLRNYVEHYQTLQEQQVDKTSSKKNPMSTQLSPAITSKQGNNKTSEKQGSIEVGEELHDIE